MAHTHTLLLKDIAEKLSQTSFTENDFETHFIRHLKALRLRAGEEIAFLSGKGHKVYCECSAVKPYAFNVKNIETFQHKGPRIELFLALPKKDALTQTLTQCSEMGIHQLSLLRTEFSDPSHKDDDKVLKRAQRVIEAATEQSQSPFLPEIHSEILKLDQVLSKRSTTLIWANENLSSRGHYGFASLSESEKLNEAQNVGLLIGPEGGWSPKECATLGSSDCIALALGPQILKVPTAALAGIYQIHLAVGASWEKIQD